MHYHPRTLLIVAAGAALLSLLLGQARTKAALLAIQTRWPFLSPLGIGAVALIPMVWMSAIVQRYAVNVPMLDDWVMANLIVRQHHGQLTFADLFVQQQEGRTLLPKLIFIASAMSGIWDVRQQIMLSWVIAWLTCGGIFFVLWRSGVSRWQVAICFWLAVLCIFSPAQYEVWLLASGFFSFLPALFIVSGVVIVLLPVSVPVKFASCAVLAFASTFTLPHGLLAWALTFPVLLLTQRLAGWRAWIAGWAALCAVGATIYFWGYYKPGYLPPFAPAVGPLEYARFFLIFLGGGLAYASTTHPETIAMVAGSAALAVFVGAVLYLVPRIRDPAVRRSSAPWLVLGVYAIGSAGLATLGRVGYGASYALASRYVPFSIYLFIAGAALTAVIFRDVHLRSRHRLAGISVFLLFSLLFVLPYERSAANTLFFLRAYSAKERVGHVALLFSQVTDTRPVISEIVYPPDANYALRLGDDLDRLGLLRPPLVRSPAVSSLPHAVVDGKDAAGRLEKIAGTVLSGWTALPRKHRPADGVVLAYRTPQRDWTICGVGDVSSLRPDIVRRFSDTNQLWAGWSATVRMEIPADATLSAWAVDAEEPKLYQLEGEFSPDGKETASR